ncbi:MAG: hypothetical protein IJP17_04205, partial [Clostridia bacterium]|nr:hypothetical protein [Clostridia bacterium]
MYNGENLRWQQTFLAHGEARIAGIKKAIVTADQQKDYETMMFLRNDLCKESVFHSDNLDCIVTFPELIKLYDEHPDTRFSSRDLMWTYKYIVEDMLDFHQVSLDKCFELIEHFKERSLQYGFSLRTYYIQLAKLYAHIDPDKTREC